MKDFVAKHTIIIIIIFIILVIVLWPFIKEGLDCLTRSNATGSAYPYECDNYDNYEWNS